MIREKAFVSDTSPIQPERSKTKLGFLRWIFSNKHRFAKYIGALTISMFLIGMNLGPLPEPESNPMLEGFGPSQSESEPTFTPVPTATMTMRPVSPPYTPTPSDAAWSVGAEVDIVLANFASDQSELNQTIRTSLINNFDYLGISYIEVDRAIYAADYAAAASLNDEYNATLVIWANPTTMDDPGIELFYKLVVQEERRVAKYLERVLIAGELPERSIVVRHGIDVTYFAHVMAGQLALLQENYVQAQDALNLAITYLQRQPTDRYDELDAHHAYVYLGLVHTNMEKYASAIEDFEYALKLNPMSAVTYNGLGNAYRRQELHYQAVPQYDKAIEIDPDYGNAYENRGISYAESGYYDLAFQDYARALELDPNDPFTYNDRGSLYLDLGSPQQAIADYTRAIFLFSNYEYPYHNRGNAHFDLGNMSEAIEDYTRAIQIDEDFMSAHYGRGTVYLQRGDYDLAIIDLSRAIELDPDYVAAYINLGLSHARRGAYYSAIGYYDQAIAINSYVAYAFANRGSAHYHLGDYEAAMADYQRYHELTGIYEPFMAERIEFIKTTLNPATYTATDTTSNMATQATSNLSNLMDPSLEPTYTPASPTATPAP